MTQIGAAPSWFTVLQNSHEYVGFLRKIFLKFFRK